ncbi:hypothetical protein PFISCL1PPCAC_2129 [Pristionchus fissidentatus]|uniref:Nucleolar protein 16 n=1 Tax=Pristionchus fissidentatus TaxID=1538716 RepID=A0AAV5UW58_9BILA|nr:hypothetical protein PFISCL1PPCAC_2129 [Pristionchus fissidentatus]
MPRSVKHGGKKRTQFRALKNSSKAKNIAKKKKNKVKTECVQLASAWNHDKTVKENMTAMGLAYNPNTVTPMVATKKSKAVAEVEMVDVSEIAKINADQKKKFKKKGKKSDPTELEVKAANVVSELEKAADKEAKDQKVGREFRLQERDIEFCVYMHEKHKDDYKAMSLDPRNQWQETPKQLEKKIRIYKNSPHFKAIESMDTA